MKLAVVLPGGGACGRWQVGVLKYFYDIGLFAKIDLVCGTSVGGLNSLLVAKHWLDFDKACDMWKSITKNKDIFNGMLQLNNFFDFMGMVGQLFKTNKGKSLLDPVGLYHTINKTFGNDKLSDLLRPVIITTTDLSTGERVVIDSVTCPDYKVSEIAKATSAIPGAFPAVDYWIDGIKDLCVDGGVLRNNPVCYAIDNGATHILLIGTSPDTYPRKEIKNEVLNVLPRLIELVMHSNEETSWDEKADHELLNKYDPVKYPLIKFLDIYPEQSTGSALDFSNVEQFQKGYDYAKANYPEELIQAFLR
jgi:predicted acylesterase/phospholipase RssA